MLGIKRGPNLKRELTKLERRVGLLDESQLMKWATRCTYDLGQHLLAYERESTADQLGYAKLAADSVQAIVAEIQRRHEEWNTLHG